MKRAIFIILLFAACFAVNGQTSVTIDSVAVQVYYRSSSESVDPSYKSNAAALQNLVRIVALAKRYDSFLHVKIQSWTSPDGTSTDNARLVSKRSESFAAWLSQNTKTPASQIHRGESGIGWHILENKMLQGSRAYSTKVLDIIETIDEWVYDASGNVINSRKKELMDLADGSVWRDMYKRDFPEMRTIVATVYYTGPGTKEQGQAKQEQAEQGQAEEGPIAQEQAEQGQVEQELEEVESEQTEQTEQKIDRPIQEIEEIKVADVGRGEIESKTVGQPIKNTTQEVPIAKERPLKSDSIATTEKDSADIVPEEAAKKVEELRSGEAEELSSKESLLPVAEEETAEEEVVSEDEEVEEEITTEVEEAEEVTEEEAEEVVEESIVQKPAAKKQAKKAAPKKPTTRPLEETRGNAMEQSGITIINNNTSVSGEGNQVTTANGDSAVVESKMENIVPQMKREQTMSSWPTTGAWIVTADGDTIANIMPVMMLIGQQLAPFSATDSTTPAYPEGFYMGLKTNLFYDVLCVPNIGVEFYIDKGWSIGLSYNHAWWSIKERHFFYRYYGMEMNVRKYFGKAAENPLNGHHIGVYGQYFTYDFEFGNRGFMGGEPGKNIFASPSFGVGLEYGYSLPVTPRMNIDFVVGMGYQGGKYHEYLASDECYVLQGTYNRHFFGPTKAEISLVWQLGEHNVNFAKENKEKANEAAQLAPKPNSAVVVIPAQTDTTNGAAVAEPAQAESNQTEGGNL